MLKSSVVLAILVVLMSCGRSTAENGAGWRRFAFGSTELRIPSEYLLSSFPAVIVPRESLDRENSVLVKIPLKDLGLTDDDAQLDSRGSAVIRLSEAGDSMPGGADMAWNQLDLYDEQVVEFDEDTQLYRVYPKSGYPVFWQYFKALPTDGGTLESSWVASCVLLSGDQADPLLDAKCDFVHHFKTVSGKVSVSGAGIRLLEDLRSGLDSLFSSWEKPTDNR